MKVFSAGNNALLLDAIKLDQAPGDPTIVVNPDGSLTLTSAMKDFDGTDLTPNGSGSSGCDDIYLVGAAVDQDGNSPIDNLGGADAVAGYLLFHESTSPGQVHSVPNPAPALPGGGKFKVRAFNSDGQDA